MGKRVSMFLILREIVVFIMLHKRLYIHIQVKVQKVKKMLPYGLRRREVYTGNLSSCCLANE